MIIVLFQYVRRKKRGKDRKIIFFEVFLLTCCEMVVVWVYKIEKGEMRMGEKETGGSAYQCGGYGLYPSHGMNVRDYFAGQAMQGLCADPSSHSMFKDHLDAAEASYQIADAMLEARK